MSIPTILVEDSKTIRDALIPTLEDLSAVQVVAIAETAQDGARAVREHGAGWQLAVVDLFLREGTGFTVLAACETRNADQRVVVLSNYATDEMRKRCLALGANAVFDKSTELDGFFEFCAALR